MKYFSEKICYNEKTEHCRLTGCSVFSHKEHTCGGGVLKIKEFEGSSHRLPAICSANGAGYYKEGSVS